MAEGKKEWRKPELIVLVRSKPEEAVLAKCKNYGEAGPGMEWTGGCGIYQTPQCNAILGS